MRAAQTGRGAPHLPTFPIQGAPPCLTLLLPTGHHKLQHLVHCGHVENDPQLGHTHGEEAPQENWGAQALS